MEVGNVVGKWGIEGVNENGQYLVDVCAERGLFIANAFFQHRLIHRHSWRRGNERSLIDFIAIDNRVKRDVLDAKVMREMFNALL